MAEAEPPEAEPEPYDVLDSLFLGTQAPARDLFADDDPSWRAV